MTEQHPITPPPELVRQWFLGAKAMPVDQWVTDVAAQASQWGADQELEACINYFHKYDTSWGEDSELIEGLRAARRPKPPSLAEQAVRALKRQAGRSVPSLSATEDCDTIRRALERLQELEQ